MAERRTTAGSWLVGIAAVVMAGLLLGGWSSVSAKSDSHETRITTLEERSKGVEKTLDAMDKKLDRLIERSK
jgi:outer membrane murein-binding lipoprotein Lpp